ncbi:MAG: nucleoside monophosphate kinase [Patescibacteria group bacterium]
MRPLAVHIIGNTCVGKSTLGLALAEEFGGTYVSFGDRKRMHIRDGTDLGRAINDAVSAGVPIAPSLCVMLMQDALTTGWNFLSGCPISLEELKSLNAVCETVCALHLCVEEDVLYRRFMQRGVCPYCHRTGTRGAWCPNHDVALGPRIDATQSEWVARQRLYHDRIAPFAAVLATRVPVWEVMVGSMNVSQIVAKVAMWIHQRSVQ